MEMLLIYIDQSSTPRICGDPHDGDQNLHVLFECIVFVLEAPPTIRHEISMLLHLTDLRLSEPGNVVVGDQ